MHELIGEILFHLALELIEPLAHWLSPRRWARRRRPGHTADAPPAGLRHRRHRF